MTFKAEVLNKNLSVNLWSTYNVRITVPNTVKKEFKKTELTGTWALLGENKHLTLTVHCHVIRWRIETFGEWYN